MYSNAFCIKVRVDKLLPLHTCAPDPNNPGDWLVSDMDWFLQRLREVSNSTCGDCGQPAHKENEPCPAREDGGY